MVDVRTHAIVDMLESREQTDVVEWLKSYPNIQVVARDGSITYHNSINEAHPKAIQISDRFHLYKNLTDYAIEYLKKHLKKIVKVVVDCAGKISSIASGISKGNQNRKLTLEEKYDKILLLQAEKINQTEICRQVNMDVRVYKKLMAASDAERRKMFTTVANTRHEDRVSTKMKIVNEVRELKSKGLSKRAISRETGLTTTTISKYLDENFNPVHASYGMKRSGVLGAFYKDIDILLNQGVMAIEIEKIMREKGYKGSSSTIRHYASEWKKRFKSNIKEDEVEDGKEIITIKRNDILKTLFRPVSDVRNLEEDKFQHFCEQYPFFKTILELINSFKDIFEQKKPNLLEEWITKAKDTKIKEIISFVNGVERDYDAVKNAVCLPYSNGLAEGIVNKIKVIKRIMYGRCSFETLRNKTIQLDRMCKFN